MDPMGALQLRLQHAWRHREDFEHEWRTFRTRDPNPYRVWHEQVDADGREYAVYVEPIEPIPDALAFIAGDCILDLRATLDNLVWSVGVAQGISESDRQRAAFLIYDTPSSFTQNRWRIKAYPKPVVDTMEALQPYNVTNPAHGSTVSIGDQLLRLERLWNRNKHRAPHILTGLSQARSITLYGWEIAESGIGPFDARYEVWRVRYTGPQLNPEIKLEYHVAVDVVLGPDEPAALESVDNLLVNLHDCVRDDVLPRFARFL